MCEKNDTIEKIEDRKFFACCVPVMGANPMNAYDQGLTWESCYEALEARKALGPTATQSDWWRVCENGEWILWQVGKLSASIYNLIRPALYRAIERIVARAIRRAQRALRGTRAPWATMWRKWARDWLSRKDRSSNPAYMMLDIVETSTKISTTPIGSREYAVNVVMFAIDAAIAAAEAESEEEITKSASYVVNAAASAVDAAFATKNEVVDVMEDIMDVSKMTPHVQAAEYELRLQANDVHLEIPEWPGE